MSMGQRPQNPLYVESQVTGLDNVPDVAGSKLRTQHRRVTAELRNGSVLLLARAPDLEQKLDDVIDLLTALLEAQKVGV